MPNSYEHLFFDLDHTLWDFEENAKTCLLEMYDHFNLQSIGLEDVTAFCQEFSEANQHYWALLERKEITVEDLRRRRFKTAFANLGIEITESFSVEMTQVFLELLPQKDCLIEGAIDVLEYLKPNYQLHILSNGWQELQVQKMQSSGILHYFDVLVTFEKANARKPEKAIFDYALHHANASLSNSLMIGDNYEADIKGAINAHWNTVFYNPEKIETVLKPTYDIGSLIELKGFL